MGRRWRRRWRLGLVAGGAALVLATGWTFGVQAQGGAPSGAPPHMSPPPATSSYLPVVEERFEVVHSSNST